MTVNISVAIATYNGGRFLAAQLASLVAQQLQPSEIIICDDGSSDDTVAVAEAFAATSPIPMQIEVNSVNLGWRANFMKAASLCSGDLVAFCDQDDIWRPEKLSAVARGFDRDDVLMVFHDAEVVDAELQPIGTLSMQRPEADITPPMRLDPWISLLGLTITFRRDLLRFWPLWKDSVDKYVPGQRAAHDQWVTFLASSLGTTVYIDEQLLHYRQHGGNSMGLALSESLRDKAAYIFAFSQVVALRLATAELRARALAAIPVIDPQFAARADAARVVYEEYADLLALQATIYRSLSRTERLRAFGRLRALDAYRGGCWRLTRSMRYRDAMAAVGGPTALAMAHRVLKR